jgi:hypothetical protein
LSDHIFISKPIHLFSDASLSQNMVGAGAFLLNETNGLWAYWAAKVNLSPLNEIDITALDIAFWEAYTILCTVCNPAMTHIRDRHLIMHCDNMSTLYAFSKFVVKSAPLRMTVRKMAQVAMERRFEPVGIYIPSQLNIADALTRDLKFAASAVDRLRASPVPASNVILNKLVCNSRPGLAKFISLHPAVEAGRTRM